MKLIFKIARNECRYLFYSPIAWFLLIVFLVQCSFFYTGPISTGASYQEMMVKNSADFKGARDSLTIGVFLKGNIFMNVLRNLYLFIPLLTMGLISREKNNGTMALLYSSPVNLPRIVFGKFLGIMLYNLLLLGIVLFFIVSGLFNIRQADHGILLSGALGFYLLVCAYSAIGMFMSSLTTYQIVSALATFAAIFILSRIGMLWQRHDLVRDLTYFLSMQNRTLKMLSGLIVTKDVIYFVLVTGMFVAFTLIRLKNGREVKPWYVKAARYTAVVAVVLIAGYISSRPVLTGYWDASATNINTIHPRTQQNLRELGDSTLEVTLYTNLLHSSLGRGLPESRNVDYLAGFWEPYLRFRPDIRFRYVYYYDNDPATDDSLFYRSMPGRSLKDIAAETADVIDASLSDFASPDSIRRHIDLRSEGYRVVMQLKYRGRKVFLRTYDDPFFWPNETNVNAAIKHLLDPDIPKIAFATGEYERNIMKRGEREFAFHTALKLSRHSLVNIGFDADTVNLTTQQIPSDITALVMADPKMDLSPIITGKLRNYIGSGGNMLLMGEPGKQYVMNPLLAQTGMQLTNGQLVQPTFHETPDKVWSYVTAASSNLSESYSLAAQKNEGSDSLGFVMMPGTTGIIQANDSGFVQKTVTTTLPDSAWLKAGRVVIDSTLPPRNPLEGDLKEKTFPTTMQLSRRVHGKDQRIIIAGDADFASNLRWPDNLDFTTSLYSWLAYNKYPIYTPRPEPKDIWFNIGDKAAAIQKTIYIWVLPGLLLLAGAILLIRRKRK